MATTRNLVLAGALVVGIVAAGMSCGRMRTSGTEEQASDSHPDIQGVWTNTDAFFTPLERPAELAGKENPIPEEIRAALEKAALEKVDGVLTQGVGSYGEEWYEYRRGTIAMAPSLIINPKSGRVPPMTAWGKERVAYTEAHERESYELMDPGDRCISRGLLGQMLPTFYNNGKQIIQTPGYVTIVSEMIHDARIIPLDDRPRPPSTVRTWTGDPRGRWEGNVLIVESTNYMPRDILRGFRVMSEELRTVERFTLVDQNTLRYSVTIDDPKVYTAPWTIEIPFTRDKEYRMFEYACHEGNHAIEGILKGARFQEKSGK